MAVQFTIVISLRSKQRFVILCLDSFSSLNIPNLQMEGLKVHGKGVNHFKLLGLAILEHRPLFCSLLVLQEVFAVCSTWLVVASLYKEKLDINFELCHHFQNHLYTYISKENLSLLNCLGNIDFL